MNANHSCDAIVEIGGADFEREVLQSKLPVLVVFLAPWSRPCQVLSEKLAEVAAACVGMARLVKVNADDYPDLSLWYDIQSIPTLLFFVRGNLAAKVIGTASKEAILTKLHGVLAGSPGNPKS